MPAAPTRFTYGTAMPHESSSSSSSSGRAASRCTSSTSTASRSSSPRPSSSSSLPFTPRHYWIAAYIASSALVLSLLLIGAVLSQHQRDVVMKAFQLADAQGVPDDRMTNNVEGRYRPLLFEAFDRGSTLISSSSSSSHAQAKRGYQKKIRSKRLKEADPAAATESPSLEFMVSNRYGSHVSHTGPYPWLIGTKLIEPYMDTTLTIAQPIEGIIYLWDMYLGKKRIWSHQGEELESIQLTLPGHYSLHLRAVSVSDQSLLAVSQEDVYCKYVRRELRGLLGEDRNLFLDAMATLWSTTTEEGQKIYGPRYQGIEYFAGYHLVMSSNPTCDHMHDGLGFMTQHVALTLRFEQAVQAVEPSFALPYWDYTLDAHNVMDNIDTDGDFSDAWFKQAPFSEGMFGGADPLEGYITNGRWAKLEILNSKYKARNAYGLMRSPWNTSKRKYLTRYSTFCGEKWNSSRSSFPSCQDHLRTVLEASSFSSYMWRLPYSPHGPVHTISGGTYGCEESYSRLKEMGVFSEEFLYWFSIYSFSNLRVYSRTGFYECPTDCIADDKKGEDCSCYCPDLESKIDNGEWPDLIIEALGTESLREEVHALPEETQITFLREICNAGILIGDHLEAASAYDPSFWPIHPTLERLWQWKKLNNKFDSEYWPSTSISIYGDDCMGHAEDDIIPIPDLIVPGMNVTNRALYDLMDPFRDTMDYVYDDFTWSQCLKYGIDFSTLTTAGTGSSRGEDGVQGSILPTTGTSSSSRGEQGVEGEGEEARRRRRNKSI